MVLRHLGQQTHLVNDPFRNILSFQKALATALQRRHQTFSGKKTAKGRCSTRQFPSKVVIPQQFAQLHSSKCLCLWTWEWLITYIHGFAVYRALSKLLAHAWDGIFHSKKRPSPQWPSQPKPVQDWLGSLDLSLPGGDLVIGWSLVGSYLPIRPS